MTTTLLGTANWTGLPRRFKADSSVRAALFLGGVGCDRTCTYNSIYGAFPQALNALGIPIFSTDTLAHTWANDTAMSAITALRTIAGTYGAKTDKVLLIGQSQGSLNALTWTFKNPTLVAAVACLLPIPNLVQMHDSPGSPSYATEIETAFGLGTGSVAGNSTITSHDPNQNQASFSGIPVKFWYSSDDPTASPTSATNFATAIGAPTVNMGALGHANDPSRAAEVASWLATYA